MLLERIQSKSARVGIIGLGYVGLPLISVFHGAGFSVTGFDVDDSKINALNEGRSYIHHISNDVIADMCASNRFCATTDFAHLRDMDAIIMCVPTPLSKYRDPDMSFVETTAHTISKYLRKNQVVILESTTYPGTSRELIIPILEKASHLVAGEDFFVGYSPEREDPGNAQFSTQKIPKVVGGLNPKSFDVAKALYDACNISTVPVSSLEAAEAVKLTENIFRSVNIALVNELKVVYDAMGIDVWEVIEAAKTKPFGFMPFYPGPGLGGHCIPIDPFYLTWKAREYLLSTRFIELAGEINTSMPDFVIKKLNDALNHRFERSIKGSRILLVGAAYKKNVDDSRESPAFVIMEKLQMQGAFVDFHDPFVAVIPHTREHPALAGKKSLPLDPSLLEDYHAALIVTDHDNVDYQHIVESMNLVVDTRNATKHIQSPSLREKIVMA